MADGASMPGGADQLVEQRECRVCGQRKPLTAEFWSGRTHADGSRLLHRRCRACDAAASRARWAADPEAQAKDRARRAKNREKIRAYDRMRAKRDLAKKRPQVRAWLAANRERVRPLQRAASSRRRAKVLEVGGTWTAADLEKAVQGQKGRCWWCSKRLGARVHADHRIPLARGGSNDPSNIVASCPTCNHSKGAKLPTEFAGRLL